MFNEIFQSLIEEYCRENKIYLTDLTYYMFPQIWADTSLGYGGWGGQAITQSHTLIVHDTINDTILLTYGLPQFITLKKPNALFWEDIKNYRLESQHGLGKYRS